MDILASLYHRYIPDPLLPVEKRSSLVLSKGHGVVAQYAVLSSLGAFPGDLLKEYKNPVGLPAHCDRLIPGIDSDSGSLGQGLSKGIGMAMRNREEGLDFLCFVLLGDGELQEGQVFESLLTLAKWNPPGLVPIVDRNFLQSDSRTGDIKDARDWTQVFQGIGLSVHTIDGHSPRAIIGAVEECRLSGRPSIILADTEKGFGASVTRMPQETPRRKGIWHAKVPNRDEYLAIVGELVESSGDPGAKVAFSEYLRSLESAGSEMVEEISGERASQAAVPVIGPVFEPVSGLFTSPPLSPATGDAFGRFLASKGDRWPEIRVLNADLEKSCRLGAFAARFPDRFLEVGISEQDMVSIAGGIALRGGIPVVNTYASFLKRAFDQIFCLFAEGLPVIIAGHYAGLDYHSDGKTHQSLNDIGFMRTVGDIEVYEPFGEEDTAAILEEVLAGLRRDWAEKRKSRPAYIRLHRSPPGFGVPPLPTDWTPGLPIVFPGPSEKRRTRLYVASGHFLGSALAIQKRLARLGKSVDIVGIDSFQDPRGALRKLLQDGQTAIVLESHQRTGGLLAFLTSLVSREFSWFGPETLSPCTRSFPDLLAFHALDEETLFRRTEEVVSRKPRESS